MYKRQYNAYVFIGNELKSARFKDTVHQVCMSHAKNKFVKASNQGGEPTAEQMCIRDRPLQYMEIVWHLNTPQVPVF